MTRTYEDMADLWRRLPHHYKNSTDAHYVKVFREEKPCWIRLSQVSEAEWSILKAVASATDSHRKQATKKRIEREQKS